MLRVWGAIVLDDKSVAPSLRLCRDFVKGDCIRAGSNEFKSRNHWSYALLDGQHTRYMCFLDRSWEFLFSLNCSIKPCLYWLLNSENVNRNLQPITTMLMQVSMFQVHCIMQSWSHSKIAAAQSIWRLRLGSQSIGADPLQIVQVSLFHLSKLNLYALWS